MLWPQDTEDGSGERSLLAKHRLVPGVAAMVTSEKPQPLSQCEGPVKSLTLGEARTQIAESESLRLRTCHVLGGLCLICLKETPTEGEGISVGWPKRKLSLRSCSSPQILRRICMTFSKSQGHLGASLPHL